MHDLGFRLSGERRSVAAAVLCGVEALSAQQWAVGAISLCAGSIRAGATGWDVSPDKNFAEPFPGFAPIKGEG